MLPELVKAGCSIFGAYRSATIDKSLYQLRALDWDTSGSHLFNSFLATYISCHFKDPLLLILNSFFAGPMQRYPVVTIYHPDSNFGHPFANVGWAGWIGSITGMSSVQMAMSEKVTDHEFGKTSRFGKSIEICYH